MDAGYLVNAWVDSGQMRGTGKFSGHYVLVYGHDGESVMAHDPGGSISRGDPHNIGKRIQIDRFDTIRRYPETNNAGAFIAYKAA